MKRRTSHRRTFDGQDPQIESRQHGRRAQGASRHARRTARRPRRGVQVLPGISVGVIVVSLVTGILVVQAAPSEASTNSSPRLIAAMACVQAWLVDPQATFQSGAACFPSHRRRSPAATGIASDDATPAAAASADDTPSDTPTTSASPTDTAPADTPTPASPSRSALATENRATAAASSTPSATGGTSPSEDPSATASPSPSRTATPAQTASSSPSPTSSSTGSASGGAFGSGPGSGPVSCHGKSGVVIQGRTFRDIGNDQPAIVIDGCSDVTISGNDFINDTEPIYVVNSTNVKIIGNRYRNITGPHTRNGSHRGNFTQWENSYGGVIRDNAGIGGDTEDVISIYKSGGRSASDPLIIEGNVFKGSGWTSSSGSGIMLGDGGGSHVIVRSNVLIDVGQVGIGVAGGSDIHITGNTIFGSGLPHSNVGLYVWGQGTSCSDIEVSSNRIDFVKDSGVQSPLWNGGTCGAVSGWSSNSTPDLNGSSLAQPLAAIG